MPLRKSQKNHYLEDLLFLGRKPLLNLFLKVKILKNQLGCLEILQEGFSQQVEGCSEGSKKRVSQQVEGYSEGSKKITSQKEDYLE